MKRTLTTATLAAGLMLAGHAAASPFLWQSNSLTYLYGKDYKVDAGSTQQTVTFEHASGWAWGDMFLFVDNIFYNGISGRDGHTYYGEFSPRLSLGKISGNEIKFGPVTDVLLAATYERGESSAAGVPNQTYLLGPAVDLALPGFDRFNLNLYYRKPDGKTGNPSGQWQLTPTWAMTIPVGKSDILFDGFIDWVINDASNSDTELKRNLHINPQIKYDLGKALDHAAGTLYVGIEYDYWSNKYGIEDGGYVSRNFVGKTDQNTFSAIVQVHF
ncbi:hypothetical protein DN824_21305 [Stutzerimonas nosocomialis]|uniref:outer membrane protein OmpK n=1 Tax=Stutzerimonas nosocomialis TaxID=1056496 RepID=UPI001108D7ED|nr:outer membrane protein OmpK [Stutzerimonas nosocomialis]TLX54085.1 hypothetical protein DN824_21305 [Stutzerimonas nosocomialis]